MADLSQLSTEELLKMRGASLPSAGADLAKVSTEDLLKMRGSDAVPETFGGRVIAGIGRGMTEIGRGIGQRVREAIEPESSNPMWDRFKKTSAPQAPTNPVADALGLPSEASTQETRNLDAPLMATGGGKLGNVIGTALPMAATAILPGANTVTGSTIIGAGMGYAQPTVKGESPIKNAAISAGVAGGLQAAGGALANKFAASKASAAQSAATEEAQNATRDAALKAGQEAGYVVPPSSVKSGIVNQTAESIGGKIATAQEASLKNAKVTDTLARQALGLGDNSLLTEGSLADIRRTAGAAYEAIKKLPQRFTADAQFQTEAKALGQSSEQLAAEFPSIAKNDAVDALKADLAKGDWSPQAVIEAIKKLRFDAGKNYKAFDDPAKAALAQAQRAAADSLDGLVERNLAASGQGSLASAYQDARVLIAKAHDVEAALTPGGHVNAQVLAKIGQDGFLDGPLKTIAQFAGNFPKAVQPIEKIGGMAHALRPTIGGTVGTVLGGPAGGAVGAVAGVAGPYAMRQMLLSGAGQRLLTAPSYGTGMISPIADLLANPAIRAGLPAAGAAAALNYRAQQ